MFYKGRIESLDRIIISDPSYGEDVGCRYERNNVVPNKDWKVQLCVNDVCEPYEDFTVKGVGFGMLLTSPLCGVAVLHPEGDGFSASSRLKMDKKTIGMDTACISLGINGYADFIKDSKDTWQPICSLKTLTDGEFGTVYEGSENGKMHLIYVSGFLDEDAGYSVQDIVDYLKNNFKIVDLELVKDSNTLDNKIADAKNKDSSSKSKNLEKLEKGLEL